MGCGCRSVSSSRSANSVSPSTPGSMPMTLPSTKSRSESQGRPAVRLKSEKFPTGSVRAVMIAMTPRSRRCRLIRGCGPAQPPEPQSAGESPDPVGHARAGQGSDQAKDDRRGRGEDQGGCAQEQRDREKTAAPRDVSRQDQERRRAMLRQRSAEGGQAIRRRGTRAAASTTTQPRSPAAPRRSSHPACQGSANGGRMASRQEEGLQQLSGRGAARD